MSQNFSSRPARFPTPCIVDRGIVVDKRDMQRLLTDLSRVRYLYFQDGKVASEGEGCIVEVIADLQSSTLVANRSLYINVNSFDYLELRKVAGSGVTGEQTCFDLVQENWLLRLLPLSDPLQTRSDRQLNAAALEAVVADVLSASWDPQFDDEDGVDF
ncbi:hypothetical protein ACN4EG_22565 [Alkalinema pantanalense CENA528]|uniref:hypothetical protein n=1 Tax=Alkalinema pantanalense TaxID=1620705 RepID=UPI003D6FF3B6